MHKSEIEEDRRCRSRLNSAIDLLKASCQMLIFSLIVTDRQETLFSTVQVMQIVTMT